MTAFILNTVLFKIVNEIPTIEFIEKFSLKIENKTSINNIVDIIQNKTQIEIKEIKIFNIEDKIVGISFSEKENFLYSFHFSIQGDLNLLEDCPEPYRTS